MALPSRSDGSVIMRFDTAIYLYKILYLVSRTITLLLLYYDVPGYASGHLKTSFAESDISTHNNAVSLYFSRSLSPFLSNVFYRFLSYSRQLVPRPRGIRSASRRVTMSFPILGIHYIYRSVLGPATAIWVKKTPTTYAAEPWISRGLGVT